MGHLSLIAEEVVKLFLHWPDEISKHLEGTFDRDAWNTYVENVLRETRDKDLQQLGGGVNSMANDTISSASGLSDEDDEFPSARQARDQLQSPKSAGISEPLQAPANGVGPRSNDQVCIHEGSSAKLMLCCAVCSLPCSADIQRFAGQVCRKFG